MLNRKFYYRINCFLFAPIVCVSFSSTSLKIFISSVGLVFFSFKFMEGSTSFQYYRNNGGLTCKISRPLPVGTSLCSAASYSSSPTVFSSHTTPTTSFSSSSSQSNSIFLLQYFASSPSSSLPMGLVILPVRPQALSLSSSSAPPSSPVANFGSVSRSRCYRPVRSSQNSSRHSFEGIQIRAFASLHQRQIRAPTRLLGN